MNPTLRIISPAALIACLACLPACSSEPPPEPSAPPPRGALTETVVQPMERAEDAFHRASEQERATIDAMEQDDTTP